MAEAIQPELPRANKRPEALLQSRLKEVLSYDEVTGLFTWRIRRGRSGAGVVAGNLSDGGYIMISVDGEPYRAHRLAFLYMTGAFPAAEVDHRDRCRHNNAWLNLRAASRSENAANTPAYSTNTSGWKGVSLVRRRGKWRASIVVNYRTIWLGYFDRPEEAAAAYAVAAKRLRGEFGRTAA